MRNPSEIRDSLGKRRCDLVDKPRQEVLRNLLANRNANFLIPSPVDDRKLRAQHVAQESLIEGFKAAAVTFVASAVPTLVAVRKFEWAKKYVKVPQQAMIVTIPTLYTLYFASEKTMVKLSRENSQHKPS